MTCRAPADYTHSRRHGFHDPFFITTTKGEPSTWIPPLRLTALTHMSKEHAIEIFLNLTWLSVMILEIKICIHILLNWSQDKSSQSSVVMIWVQVMLAFFTFSPSLSCSWTGRCSFAGGTRCSGRKESSRMLQTSHLQVTWAQASAPRTSGLVLVFHAVTPGATSPSPGHCSQHPHPTPTPGLPHRSHANPTHVAEPTRKYKWEVKGLGKTG